MNTANEMVLTDEQRKRINEILSEQVTEENGAEHLKKLIKLKRLILKRELIFELIGKYGGTAILDYVRHDIVERIDNILKK